MNRVRFVDLRQQYLRYQAEFDRAIAEVIEETAFIGGRFVEDFERALAEKYGVPHVVSCANGTDAIYIVLKMLGVGPGDEVVTTAHSWISTSEVVSQCGATVRFVDTDDFYHMDAAMLEDAITPTTRAVIPVHLYGQPADLDQIMAVCSKRGVHVLEDCAQAHFATWRNRLVGTFGVAGTFSFYPGKNLGAWGDAGAIVTSDAGLAERCRMYANHGALRKHHHQMDGINSRLDGLQAAVLGVKLRHIHEWTDERRVVAGWYEEALAGIPQVELPRVRPNGTHVWHLFVVQVPDRTAVQQHLAEHGIETAVHYPSALPLLPPYRGGRNVPGNFPRAARRQERILSLPMYPEMRRSDVQYVADVLAAYFSRND